MTTARYTPLSLSLSQAQAPGPSWWRRRALHASFVIIVTISVYALFEYAIHITGDDTNDLDGTGHTGDPVDTSLDAAYLPFKPNKPETSKALRPGTVLPSSCLDAHIAQGALCYNPGQPRLDVLWTWVNGSDILHKDARIRVENSFLEDAPYRPTSSWKKERQFRSVMSIVLNLSTRTDCVSGIMMNSGSQCDLFLRTSDSLLDSFTC